MLNELWELSNSLEKAGIVAPSRHPRLTWPRPSGGTYIRVRLTALGSVGAVEDIAEDERGGLWAIGEGNQNFFPVCRLAYAASDNGWAVKTSDLIRRLARKAEELRDVCGGDEQLAHVRAMAERFLLATRDPGRLYQELRERGSAELKGGKKYQFAFDIDFGADGGPTTIYRSATMSRVGRALPLDQDRRRTSHPAQACAYTGAGKDRLQVDAFPKVQLPILKTAFPFPLVSMFSEAPCNHRYGLSDSSVVPVSQDAALQMQGALAYIVADEREGRTWRGVRNGHYAKSSGKSREPQEQNDLLIVYVQAAAALPARIADFFGGGNESELRQFEVDASAVCEALDAIPRHEPASRLNIFVLRGVSKGQAQVQLSARPTVQAVIRGAQQWQLGGKNLPLLRIRAPADSGSGSVFMEPRTPHPDRLVSITSRQWVEAGLRWSAARGASLNQVLDVMLGGAGWEAAANELLRLAVDRTWALMIGVGGAELRWSTDHPPAKSVRHALATAAAIGILLHKLGHEKEDYMHEAPFLVGRLLALADVLHREHSLVERKADKLPPQLIGNALMPVARENPTQAVARLGERLPLYTSWVERTPDARIAKWARRRIQQTTTELQGSRLASHATDADRAQLIIGYLADLSDKDAQEHATEQTNGGNNE